MNTYYVYMLRCEGNTLYTGTTPDIIKRIRTHYYKETGCAKFTKSHPVTGVAMVWEADSRTAAMKAEYYIKTLARKEKEKLLAAPGSLTARFGEKLDGFSFRPLPSLTIENCIKGDPKMNNIVLIGMPGAGKSTVGVLLAKTLGYQFADTDLFIQTRAGKTLQEIINSEGLEHFIALEHDIIRDLSLEKTVIATGGSAVLGEGAQETLRSLGEVIYLEVPVRDLKRRLYNIKTRGIAMKKDETIEDVLALRTPLYERCATVTVHTRGKSAEEVVEEIENALKK